MPSEWIDFRAVKESVSMEMILAHYNVRVRKVNQTYLRGKCPLPSHTSKESGDSFGVHAGKNVWACQSDSCVKARRGRKGGNVLDFVALMENCSIREAAAKLQDWFRVASPATPTNDKNSGTVFPDGTGEGSKTPDSNRPLEFTLKDVNPEHEYFAKRGISREAASVFGAGFFPGRGSMVGRVVIPIHDREGRLLAYAGRSIDGSEPKYKLPAGFHKSAELYNLHRAHESRGECVIVVEGFFDSMKVHQAGYPSVVALMGSAMSEKQEELLAAFQKIILMLDGDEAGREGAKTIAERLIHRIFVRVVDLADGKQPDQLSAEEIRSLLGSI